MSSNRQDLGGEPDKLTNGILLLARVLSRAIDISREHERAGVTAGTMQILEEALDEQAATPDEVVKVWAVLQLGTFAAKKVIVRKHSAIDRRPEEQPSWSGDSPQQN
ncbi:MAG: hypothetical protein M3014_08910 [Chloroflexota bacterium]|nr:hypothetical protein [Chloroflexota bacterium]